MTVSGDSEVFLSTLNTVDNPIHVLFLYDTVPEVNVMVPDITNSEGDPNITVCIILSTGITEQVIVTAVTGPKSGTANPATGKSNYSTSTQCHIDAKCKSIFVSIITYS